MAGPFDDLLAGLDRWAKQEAEHARFRACLEDIANGRWNTASRHLDTGSKVLSANEYAKAALNPNVAAYQEGAVT